MNDIQAFKLLAEAVMASTIKNPIMALSCADEDRELCDLHDWTTDIESLARAFGEQGYAILSIRGDTRGVDGEIKKMNWGSYLLISQGGEPDELVVDWNANKVTDEIHTEWMGKLYA